MWLPIQFVTKLPVISSLAGAWLAHRQDGKGDGAQVIQGAVSVLWMAVRRFVQAGICPFFMYDALRLAEKRSSASLQLRGALMWAASRALNHFFRSLQVYKH